MKGLSPEQLAQKGVFYLEEAVLGVLLEAKYKQECLQPAEISRRAGISYTLYDDSPMAYGVLGKLEAEGRVERNPPATPRAPWQLTEKEFEKRRND